MGGGIFYGLRIWQGKALGCPEPIVQEVHSDSILPYHSHFSPDISYGGPPSAGGPYSGGYDTGVYSNTPSPSYPGGGGTSYSNAGGASYATGGANSGVYDSPPPSASGGGGAVAGPANAYLPPSNRRYGTQRGISDQSSTIVTDLLFRFLGVKTLECKKRFVCELEFRNPFMGYAMKYLG